MLHLLLPPEHPVNKQVFLFVSIQVKNFGRSGRTKYTHLADQDTTEGDSPWNSEMTLSRKFQAKMAGGFKQSFEKPTAKRGDVWGDENGFSER